MSTHAFLSASGAPTWTLCYAKPQREKNFPEEKSIYADEGIRAHELLYNVLTYSHPHYQASPWLVRKVSVELPFSEEMCDQVQKTIDFVRSLMKKSTQLYCEQQLPLEFLTGEKDATCTSDVILLSKKKITIIDLKYGLIRIDADNNAQLMIYARAAVEALGNGAIESVEMIIHQPRLDHISRWKISTKELTTATYTIGEIAKTILTDERHGRSPTATPGEKQCRFCKARDVCPERRDFALNIIANDSVDLTQPTLTEKIQSSAMKIPTISDAELGTCAENIDFIRSWCDSVERELRRRLMADHFDDNRFKLVQGRRGNRKFSDEEAVAEICSEHGVTNIYTCDLLSPAALQKVFPKKEHAIMWAKLDGLITRSEGGPIVVPASDERVALNLALDFEPIEDEDMAVALLGLTTEEKNE